MRLLTIIGIFLGILLTGCCEEKDLIGSWRCTSTDVCDGVWSFNGDHSFAVSYELTNLLKKVAPKSGMPFTRGPVTATWKLDNSKDPCVLTITLTDGTNTLNLNAIVEFPTGTTMRFGADGYDVPPPASFDKAAAIATFERK